jgi:hypothetical protein
MVAPPAAPAYAPPVPAPYAPPAPALAPAPAAPAPAAAGPAPAAGRPLLAPLVGELAWRAEVPLVLAELIASLPADKAAMVRGIPLQFDASPTEINAYAGCDKQGSPFLAATVGLLYAVDAIAQTSATDELYATHTYEAYAGLIAPELVKPHGQSPALPLNVIPPEYWLRPERMSRAHEMFDEIVAFTFGHELSHHYLGHTGCAIGSQAGGLPDIAAVGRIVSGLAPGFNQPNEIAADAAGVNDVLDTGRARLPRYRWTEKGGLLLLDFFARMDRAAGLSPLSPIGFLQTHPNPALRIPIAQAVARTWWLQHPGP